jgi:hypothetical protein
MKDHHEAHEDHEGRAADAPPTRRSLPGAQHALVILVSFVVNRPGHGGQPPR